MFPRYREPELMDDPELEDRKHLQALSGLERLNFFSASAQVVWNPIRALAEGVGRRPIRVLDIATGGGDIPIALWKKARASGAQLQIEGCDLSGRAIEYARQRAMLAGADVKFFLLDALKSEIPPAYDVIISSLFMHHLDPDEVVLLLKKMACAADKMVLVNDLARSKVNVALVYLATRLLSRSAVVHFDGPVSVRAAYTQPEMRELAHQAGLDQCATAGHFPCRFLLTWRRP